MKKRIKTDSFFLILNIPFNINNIYAAVIDEVRFEGNKRIPDTRITPYLIKAGNEFDIKEFNESIKKLYGTGLFLNIDGDLSVDGDKFVLFAHALLLINFYLQQGVQLIP